MATVECAGQMITVHGTGYGESGANGRRDPLRLSALCFALLTTCLWPLSQASAQPAQGVPSDFSGLGGARTIIVADDSGKETKGRLLRFTPNSLTMTVEGRELVFAPQDVRTIYERGDRLKNGAKIGFYTGAVIGIALGLTRSECSDPGIGGPFSEVGRPCDSGDKFVAAAFGGVGILGGLGAAIGTGIDALIRRQRLLYERPGASGTPVVSVEPSFAPSSARLQLRVAW